MFILKHGIQEVLFERDKISLESPDFFRDKIVDKSMILVQRDKMCLNANDRILPEWLDYLGPDQE